LPTTFNWTETTALNGKSYRPARRGISYKRRFVGYAPFAAPKPPDRYLEHVRFRLAHRRLRVLKEQVRLTCSKYLMGACSRRRDLPKI
jgi:hypothetical protein